MTPPLLRAGPRVSISSEISPIANDSFISPLVELYGNIEVGQRTYVAPNTVISAGEALSISLGDENNCQDNAYLFAEHGNLVFGDMVSIAHQAVIHDSVVGDFTFFGFRSRTISSEIGEGAMILHNTIVENVTIAPNRIVPSGAWIRTQAQADALNELAPENVEFMHEVQHVNVGFARAYIDLYEKVGRSPLEDIGPNPVTSFNPVSTEPQLGERLRMAELVNIVGDVRIGENCALGQRTSIRADEGTPIVIGRRARIRSRVTFHALVGTSVTVGENAHIGDECVIHGPLTIGNNFTAEDGCVAIYATIEDNVSMRAGSTVASNIVLREGTIVPESTVVTTQEQADALPRD